VKSSGHSVMLPAHCVISVTQAVTRS
jgi:hypothetical protein